MHVFIFEHLASPTYSTESASQISEFQNGPLRHLRRAILHDCRKRDDGRIEGWFLFYFIFQELAFNNIQITATLTSNICERFCKAFETQQKVIVI